MTTKRRRLLFAISGLGLLLLTLFILATANEPRYRAESIVMLNQYTNVVFSRSFETRVKQTNPTVLHLRVMPTLSGIPTPTVPTKTNGVAIVIIASGSSAESAQSAAVEASRQLAQMVEQEYGITATADIFSKNLEVRPYSLFHDRIQPSVMRLFKR